MVKYALLDWDNTLRKGFTITSWMEYLFIKKVIDEGHYKDLLNQFELCNINKITYNQLGDNTASIYASAISGIEVSALDILGREFCSRDDAIFPYTKSLFDCFHKNEIEIIVISGAPQILLMKYAEFLGIDKVYGLIVEKKDGYFMGEVKKDFGTEKTQIVQKICKMKGCKPIFAIGDSAADMPLLDVAKYGYFVDKLSGNVFLKNKKIGSVNSANEMVKRFQFF